MVQADLFGEPAGPRVYTVSEINERVRRLLDEAFGTVHVEGEISNLRLHASGIYYFTQKDAQAQLPCVLFRTEAAALRFKPENGLHVRARGTLAIYAAQGKYQLQVLGLVPEGLGALELAFRQLRDKLEAEGLFDPARKRRLPRLPRRVALVTSPTGAAVRDMITTLSARWPLLHILVVPVAVQGDAAPGESVRALDFVNRVDAAAVVIVGRGGGSLEDLWAFNDEGVARAIAASRLPVVSAVGHEVDFTIADLVADLRAPTPTGAAALVVPHRDEVRKWLRTAQQRLATALRRRLEVALAHLEKLRAGYGMKRPLLLLQQHVQSLDLLRERLERAHSAQLERHVAALAGLQGRLQALSPRGILTRGYTYCVDAATGQVVARAAATRPRQALRLQFADGTVPARVEEKE